MDPWESVMWWTLIVVAGIRLVQVVRAKVAAARKMIDDAPRADEEVHRAGSVAD